VVTGQDLLEGLDSVLQRDESSLDTSEDLGDGEGLRHEPARDRDERTRVSHPGSYAAFALVCEIHDTHLWIFRARSTVSLSSSDNSSIPKMAMISCNDL
jgi:hypothetical protein